MTWLLTGDMSLCSEGHYHQTHRRVKLNLFTFLIQVCTFFLSFHLDSPKLENIEHLNYPAPDPDVVNPSGKTTQLMRKSSASPSIRGQSHRPSNSSSDAHATHGTYPFQKATPEELGHPTSQQISREQNPSRNGLQSRSTSASGRLRHVLEEDDGGQGSTEPHAKLVAPDGPSGKEIARLEDVRLIELERQLSETLVAKAERDRCIAQQADELALKSALLEQAAEEKSRAKMDLRELQAKLDEALLSRDHALEQAQSALQKASFAVEANQQSRRELTEMRAELDASKSELAAFRLRLADADNGGGKSKAMANTYRTQTATGLDNADEDRVVHRLLERMQAMEAEIASLRLNEKSFDMMECRNEG